MLDIAFKNKDGKVVDLPVTDKAAINAERYDVKCRTIDKRVVYWLGGQRHMDLNKAVEVFTTLSKMEGGYVPLCIQEF